MKLYVSLPELRRIGELLSASKDRADERLRDRVWSLVTAETNDRARRRQLAIQQAAGTRARAHGPSRQYR